MSNVHFVEIRCKDGYRTRIRADEIGTVIERKTPAGLRVTIPTKAKTIETDHTLEDLWRMLEAALGGNRAMVFSVPLAPFPDPNAEPAPPPPVKPPTTAAKKKEAA